jgi:hypothetical protein
VVLDQMRHVQCQRRLATPAMPSMTEIVGTSCWSASRTDRISATSCVRPVKCAPSVGRPTGRAACVLGRLATFTVLFGNHGEQRSSGVEFDVAQRRECVVGLGKSGLYLAQVPFLSWTRAASSASDTPAAVRRRPSSDPNAGSVVFALIPLSLSNMNGAGLRDNAFPDSESLLET